MKGTYITTDDIFTATSYNQRGQVTGYTLGNGLSTTRGYDDFGFPTTIQTPGIQNLAYQFDIQTGNLNRREDVAKTLQEDFTYDNLMKNRLETWQVGSGTTYTNQYSSNGNIGSKTWLGSYHYESGRPHAVTSVDNTDGWIWGQNQSVDYTPFNKVRTIREGDYKLEIIYGPDKRRKKTILYRDANSTVPLKSVSEVINWVPFKTKYFVGGIYEEELVEAATNNTSEINYVSGGDGLAAIFVKDGQGENLYYIHKDHLGSYQAVSDESGLLKEELYFSPWGNRGSATTWSYPLSQNEGFYGRGFTGHEHLPEFNLINMNGRVYDPILGRFLSPDNYIQLPDYTQSLNRYSYCLNNPLIYTDPDGEFAWAPIIALAIQQAIVGGARANLEGESIALGALKGAVTATVTSLVAGGMGMLAPSFNSTGVMYGDKLALIGKYAGKAGYAALTAAVSSGSGMLVSDLIDNGEIDIHGKDYWNTMKTSGLISAGISVGNSIYKYATWDHFTLDEKIEVLKSELGINNLELDAFERGYGTIRNGNIILTPRGLENKSVSKLTIFHEKFHVDDLSKPYNPNSIPQNKEEIRRILESRAHLATLNVAPSYNIPSRYWWNSRMLLLRRYNYPGRIPNTLTWEHIWNNLFF